MGDLPDCEFCDIVMSIADIRLDVENIVNRCSTLANLGIKCA